MGPRRRAETTRGTPERSARRYRVSNAPAASMSAGHVVGLPGADLERERPAGRSAAPPPGPGGGRSRDRRRRRAARGAARSRARWARAPRTRRPGCTAGWRRSGRTADSPASANRSVSTNSTRPPRPRRAALRRATSSAPGSTSAATNTHEGVLGGKRQRHAARAGADVEGERLVLRVRPGDGRGRQRLEGDLDQRLRLGPRDEHVRRRPRGRWCGTRAGRGCRPPARAPRSAARGAPRTGRASCGASACGRDRGRARRAATSSARASSSSASRRGERDPLARSRWAAARSASPTLAAPATLTPRRRPPAACAGPRRPAPR